MRALFLGFLLFLSSPLWAQKFEPIDKQSEVKFTIRNFGLTVEGFFSGLQGEIYWDPSQPSKSFFDVTVKAATVNTGIDLRDKHLRKEDFFNATVYPIIRFQSAEITATAVQDTWNVRGWLIMKGKKREYSFPFNVLSTDFDRTMQGDFKINRRDFNIGGNSLSMSDQVEIKFVMRIRPIDNLQKQPTRDIH